MVDCHHLKRMAMQMHRIRHHRVVVHVDEDAPCGFHDCGVVVRPDSIVELPFTPAHIAASCDVSVKSDDREMALFACPRSQYR
jgi:hypothetical protein